MSEIQRNKIGRDWKDDLKYLLFQSKYKNWIVFGAIFLLLLWLGIVQINISISFGNSGLEL